MTGVLHILHMRYFYEYIPDQYVPEYFEPCLTSVRDTKFGEIQGHQVWGGFTDHEERQLD
jgi:hypothetical protein